MVRLFLSFIALGLSGLALQAESIAADAREPTAEEFVLAALQAEADGDFLSRQYMLNCAANCDSEAPSLKSQQGYLHLANGRWLSLDECIALCQGDQRLAEYEARRRQLRDTLEAHWAMALWCQSKGMLPQARAHAERVLQFDTDNLTARRALGYQLLGGEWISPTQIAALVSKAQTARQSILKYGKQLRQIAHDLRSGDVNKRAEAKQRLIALSDADCIPAVEYAFRGADTQTAELIVDWLGEQDNVSGSQALLRYAGAHFSPQVREAAVEQLKTRPLHDYVPELLGILSSPVLTLTVPAFNRDGSLAGYQQAFAREDQDKFEVLAINTEINRVNQLLFRADADQGRPGNWTPIDSTAENFEVERSLRAAAEVETRLRTSIVGQRNAAIADSNYSVSNLLSKIVGREFSGDPREMWHWWDEVNETGYQQVKASRYRTATQRISIPRYRSYDYVETPTPAVRDEVPLSTGSRQPVRRRTTLSAIPNPECFVAGTAVLTSKGLRPIETIVPGDTVFARDIHRGTLMIKPVLQATSQPPAQTVSIDIDSEQFTCTRGHLFWVSGTGWKKASDIVPGDVLHSATHPAVVTGVEPSDTVATYNLRVADSGTYFVGEALVLSHDVLPRQANYQTVPGLH